MDSSELIDAQFDRAVEIVQSLPKNGPIQTGYEEKLTMYSLYKQATVGNVKGPRPGLFDMLGRAKWDAWEKHKDLDQYEAKWLYVDALLKVLRRYSDRTIARDLVQELESYGGDPANLVMSRSLSRTPGSSSSASSASNELHRAPASSSRYPQGSYRPQYTTEPRIPEESSGGDMTSGEEGEGELIEEELASPYPPPPPSHPHSMYAQSSHAGGGRPQSSLSSHRYRTPMAGSLAFSPPPAAASVPLTQPHPGFETPSAFEGPRSPPFARPPAFSQPPPQMSRLTQSPPGAYRAPGPSSQYSAGRQYSLALPPPPVRPTSQVSLERAVENVQHHLAALSERLETLELVTGHPQRSNQSLSTKMGSGGRDTPADRGDEEDVIEWDLDDMGLWSLVLNPLSRIVTCARHLTRFLAHNEHRSPTLIVFRRLFLDISFLLCVLALARALWRKSGVRRREVKAALFALWRAVIGSKQAGRTMLDRGV